MKMPDVNMLLYAVNANAPQHPEAKRWLEAAFNAPEGIGFAWNVVLGFLRLGTRHSIFPAPHTRRCWPACCWA